MSDPSAATEPILEPTRPQNPPRTPLAALLEDLPLPVELHADPRGGPGTDQDPADTVVTGVSLSSQRVRPGDLYAALPGARAHGIDFLAAAREAGAVAVLTDAAGREAAAGSGLPVLVCEAPRRVLGEIAARIYGDPALRMRMIGVTGTQGKTTTTRLLEGGLSGAGIPAGVIGTVGTRMAGHDVKTSLTTPEAPDLHGLFARMVEESVHVCAMEISSHALVLGRVDGVRFDVAVFLNLGRDHLDFHADLEDYYRAKAMLFSPERARRAVICVDDEHGRRLAGEAAERGLPVRTLSRTGSGADWYVSDLVAEAGGSSFTIHGPDLELPAHSPLPGEYNVTNMLAAVAAITESELPGEAVAAVVAAIGVGGGVPGRLEPVTTEGEYTVIVDYAHKPDAVSAAITALRALTWGRVIVAIGAGGDRDVGKRPLMGETAARLADVLIVTDDNPRTEDPAAIRAEILAGVERVDLVDRAEVVEIGDRREAIETAVTRAGAGDIVLIAGKGHETGQEIHGVVHPFDDRQVAVEVAAADQYARAHGSGIGSGLRGGPSR